MQRSCTDNLELAPLHLGTPRRIPQPECEASQVSVVPGDAETLLDPPAANHSRVRASSSELPNPEVSLPVPEVSFSKGRRINTKTFQNVADRDTSSSISTADDDDVLLTQTKRCMFIASMVKLSVCPMGWQFVDDCFSLEPAHVEVTTREVDVLSPAHVMEAKRWELEDFFGHLVWNVHRGPEQEKDRVLKARWRANVRLVLQAFNDPDALAGRIVTTSPVISRLGKNLCLTLAASDAWRLWCADVKTTFLRSAPQTTRLYVQLLKDAAEIICLVPSELMIFEKAHVRSN